MLYILFTIFLGLAPADVDMESRIRAADAQAGQARSVGDVESYLAYAESAYDMAEMQWGDGLLSTAVYAQKFGDAVLAAEDSGATLVSAETIEKAPRAYQRCIDIYGARADYAMMRGECQLGLGIVRFRLGDHDAAKLALSDAESSLAPYQESNAFASYSMLLTLAYGMFVEAVGLDLALQVEEFVDEVKAERILKKADRLMPLLRVHEELEEELIAQITHAEAHALHALKRYQEASAAYAKARDIYYALYGENRYESVLTERSYQWTKGMSFVADDVEKGVESYEKGACMQVTRNKGEIEYCVDDRSLPKYPFEALLFNQRGFVFVRYDIAVNGKVKKPEIVSGWPGDAFNKAALRAVRKWRYTPPRTETGESTAVDGVVTIMNFTIDQVSPEWEG